MSVYIVCGGTTYSNIKRVSFAPEYDPTLATLPVCQFEAEIVTDTAPGDLIGQTVALYEDSGNARNTKLADLYDVYEAEQIGRGVVRILAKSLLAWLEKRKLATHTYSGTYSALQFLRDLFTETPLEGPVWTGGSNPPIMLWEYRLDEELYINGYCPEQTARERLLWFCQAFGMKVVQWSINSGFGLYVCPAVEEYYGFNGKCFNDDQVYTKPKIKPRDVPSSIVIYGYSGFTRVRHTEDGWDSVVTGYSYELAEDGIIAVEERLYYAESVNRYNNPNGGNGTEMTYSGNYMTWPAQAASTGDAAQAITAAAFMPYEVEAEIKQIPYTDNSYFFPGQSIVVCLEPGVWYRCVVKSCNYTFGKFQRTKCVLYTDLIPVATGTVIAQYQYSSNGSYHTFMSHTYQVPAGKRIAIPNPTTISCWVGDSIMHFHRSTGSQVYSPTVEAGETKTQVIYYYIIQ